jgi:hypothetical protein
MTIKKYICPNCRNHVTNKCKKHLGILEKHITEYEVDKFITNKGYKSIIKVYSCSKFITNKKTNNYEQQENLAVCRCGTTFIKRGNNHIYCNDRCSVKYFKERHNVVNIINK